jgi:hypothetical protein
VQLTNLKVGGTISGTNIVAAGNIGAINVGSITNSGIYAGVTSTIIQNGGLPASASDFSATGAVIKSIQLAKTGTFTASTIAAGIIGSLQLRKVATTSGGTSEGVAAGAMTSFSALLDTGTNLVLGKAQLKNAATLSAYFSAKGITGFNNFEIDLLV